MGVYLSTNNGTSWTGIDLTNAYHPSPAVPSLAVSGTNLFAGTGYGVYLSTNNGTSWTAKSTGLKDKNALSLAVSGPNLFSGTLGGGVYLSTDNGISWNTVDSGLTDKYVSSLAVSGNSLFAGAINADDGVYLSTDNGTSWNAVDSGLTSDGKYVLCLAVSGANLFAGSLGGVFLSTNNGTCWSVVNNGLTDFPVSALTASGNNLFAGTMGWDGRMPWGHGYHSTDNGNSWVAQLEGVVTAFAIKDGNVFAAVAPFSIDGHPGVFLSTDNGTSWTEVDSGMSNHVVGNNGVSCFAVNGPNLLAGTGSGVFLSTNNGTSWTLVNAGLTDTNVTALAIIGTNLFAGTGSGVWRRPLSEVTSVSIIADELPSSFGLDQNYPNPFNPTTTIKYELPMSSEVRLSVYDMLGREVSVLVNERREAGVHEVKFDASGLSSGVYFYRIQAGDYIASKKMLVLK